MANMRELSKQSFISSKGNTIEAINCGSLQRIADATELMSKNYVQLQKGKEYYQKAYCEKRDQNERLYRQISAMKGVITKLKNKAKC
jgi:hypothetical protein